MRHRLVSIVAAAVVAAALALGNPTFALAAVTFVHDSIPLSRYALDQHVDAGLTNLSGTVNAIPHAIAAIIWSIDRHLASWTISLFTKAFDANFLVLLGLLWVRSGRNSGCEQGRSTILGVL